MSIIFIEVNFFIDNGINIDIIDPYDVKNAKKTEVGKMKEKHDALVKAVTDLSGDVTKAASGNKTAATRVRVSLQNIKNMAQELRIALAPSNQGGK